LNLKYNPNFTLINHIRNVIMQHSILPKYTKRVMDKRTPRRIISESKFNSEYDIYESNAEYENIEYDYNVEHVIPISDLSFYQTRDTIINNDAINEFINNIDKELYRFIGNKMRNIKERFLPFNDPSIMYISNKPANTGKRKF